MTERFRVIVTGSRNWVAEADLRDALMDVATEHPDMLIVHGACPRGADAMAATWARNYGYPAEPHPADWARFGKSAGYRRNAEMVSLGAGLCMAFIRDGSPGASHCANCAEQAGIPARRFYDRTVR